MRLVVDSSVALKWFVSEPQEELAKSLLDANERLLAPDLILSEIANSLWRKARMGEVTIAQVSIAIDEMENFLELRRVDATVMQTAFALAQRLSHSIYDCVFLAYALAPEMAIVTADTKFSEKAISAGFADKIRILGDAPISVAFSEASLAALGKLYARFIETREFVEHQVGGQQGKSDLVVINTAEIQPAFDSPTYRRLSDEIGKLTPHQAANLIATCWLGRGYDGQDYTRLYRQAAHLAAEPAAHAPYVVSLLHYLESGIALSRQRNNR